MKFGILPPGSW